MIKKGNPRPVIEDPIVPKIRAIARRYGWAIGSHGTMKRDVDLIAVPWTSPAASWYKVFVEIERVVGDELGCVPNERFCGRKGLLIVRKGSKPYDKKHERNWKPPQIDISFIDPRTYRP